MNGTARKRIGQSGISSCRAGSIDLSDKIYHRKYNLSRYLSAVHQSAGCRQQDHRFTVMVRAFDHLNGLSEGISSANIFISTPPPRPSALSIGVFRNEEVDQLGDAARGHKLKDFCTSPTSNACLLDGLLADADFRPHRHQSDRRRFQSDARPRCALTESRPETGESSTTLCFSRLYSRIVCAITPIIDFAFMANPRHRSYGLNRRMIFTQDKVIFQKEFCL